MLIRRLEWADRAAFRGLRQVALETNPNDFTLTAEEEAGIERLGIEDALERPRQGNCFWGVWTGEPAQLAAIGGLISGTQQKTRHCGRITSLYVDAAHRRRGFARLLLDKLLSEAAAAGLRYVRLEVVADNEPAVSLYEKAGFTVYGRESGAYRLGEREWDLLYMNLVNPPT